LCGVLALLLCGRFGSFKASVEGWDSSYNAAGRESSGPFAGGLEFEFNDGSEEAGGDTGGGELCRPPIADFSTKPAEGALPLLVQFTDLSTSEEGCEITDWYWVFGDGGESTERNPRHVYERPGLYSVTLTVVSEGGIGSAMQEEAVFARTSEARR